MVLRSKGALRDPEREDRWTLGGGAWRKSVGISFSVFDISKSGD